MSTPGFFKNATSYVPEFLKEIFGSEDDELEDPIRLQPIGASLPAAPSRASNKTQASSTTK